MTTKLIAHEQPISRIFSNDYVFHIPPYQRPYAWTTEVDIRYSDGVRFLLAQHVAERPLA